MMSAERPILSFAQSLDGGGVERTLLRLAGGWQRAGRRVMLVLGDTRGPLSAELPPGVEVREAGSRNLVKLAAAVARVARDAPPQVLFCPGNHYTSAALLVRLRLGGRAPAIVAKISNHLLRSDRGPVLGAGNRAWLRLHPRFVDRLVAMSPAMAEEAIAALRFPPSRVSVIANPPVEYRVGEDAPPAMPNGRYLIGVGRLVRQKRWDRLIAAMPRLADRDAHLVIVGEGRERAALAAQAAALGLAGRVTLPGYVADPRPLLAAAAVAVLVSEFEGVPGVLREALALGTPVVATDSSVAMREIVAHPTLGTVVAQDDPAALGAALDRWLSPGAIRPERQPEPGADSVQRYLALFDAVAKGR